jgi:hypothetical protein
MKRLFMMWAAALLVAACGSRTVVIEAPVAAAPSTETITAAPAGTAQPAAGTDAALVARARAAIDSARLLRDISVLAHDSMEGRLVGTPGSERAQRFLLRSFGDAGLQRLGDSYAHPFTFTRREQPMTGVNIVGMVRGTARPDRYIVVTAHYDHLGVRNGEIFNGADDNASGTGGLLAIANYFVRNPPAHSMIFVAFDAEEGGLQGARAFVANPPVPRDAIALNVNMDMIGRNDANELYVAGTHHYPHLLPHIQRLVPAVPVRLIPGHDTPNPANPSDDWSSASDHGAFHAVRIPFLYFGVEDHPDYHRPSDTLEGIQPGFYVRAVTTVLSALKVLDAGL